MTINTKKRRASQEQLPATPPARHEPDAETCQRLWLLAQPRIEEIDESELPTQLPRLNVLDLVVALLGFVKDHVQPFLGNALQWFHPKKAALFEEALANLGDEALALFHAEGMRTSQGSLKEQRLREALARDLEHAEESRARGLHWLEILVALGHVPEDTVRAIRTGRGQLDLASDLVTISAYLGELWEVLEPLQVSETRDTMRIDEDGIDAMALEGRALLELLSGISDTDDDGVDWRRQVIALYSLLEKDHTALAAVLTFVHQIEGNQEELAEISSLASIYRRSIAPAPSRKSGKDEQETTTGEPEADEPRVS